MYRLRQINHTQYISCQARGVWWKEPAYRPYHILSDLIPEGLNLMVHYGLTTERMVGVHYDISDMQTGTNLTKKPLFPNYDLEKLCTLTILMVSSWSQEQIRNAREVYFHQQIKQLEYKGIYPYTLDLDKFSMWAANEQQN